MPTQSRPLPTIPAYALYGEDHLLPDILHCERILDRAALHDWAISAHRHPHVHQLFVIRRGETRLGVDGAVHHLNAPVVVNMPRWTVHSFRFSKGTDGYVLTIPIAEAPEVFDKQPDLSDRLAHWGTAPASDQLCALFDQIQFEHGRSGLARTLMLKSLSTLALCQVARCLTPTQSPDAGHRSAQIMAQFEQLAQRHFRDRWRVADYAAALAMTPTHLSRVCREMTGAPASGFVETILFREACRHLAYTRADIRSVGFDLGFDDPAYFSRMFRRRVGLSPSDYRKRVNDGYSPDLTHR
ncbi:helix-turn-helix domain-containing protein [Thalassovita taeanensis]|uniref:AraC family transcriptional regulator, transcriptional activator of pobA n=1 Tax=Thalassovita taeanensis TaxID=657014 RepID=A0A1H9A7E8_9RHOB|nr:helix-turn-helix domain-containing protein [Thalassovita taeanensis]SEP72652.1 AraC family transcriptional regulator, transcriptional activator of pobA [Thalassovita taeanensis]